MDFTFRVTSHYREIANSYVFDILIKNVVAKRDFKGIKVYYYISIFKILYSFHHPTTIYLWWWIVM